MGSLKPGDLLLYGASGWVGWVIAVKTWHKVSHCEVYVGNGQSVASRDGIGVGRYPLRTEGLLYVLRPTQPLDQASALAWFQTVDGQRYDWLGLFRFFTLGKQSTDKQFCSEFATRFYRHGGLEPFTPLEDADLIAPATFLLSPAFVQFTVQAGQLVPREAGV